MSETSQEKKTPLDEAVEKMDKASDGIEKYQKVKTALGGAESEKLGALGGALSLPKNALEFGESVNKVGDGYKKGDAAGEVTNDLNVLKSGASIVEIGGKGLQIAGVESGGAIAAGAGAVGSAAGAGIAGYKTGQYLAKAGDDPDHYTVDRDGNALYGRRADGKPKTRQEAGTDRAAEVARRGGSGSATAAMEGIAAGIGTAKDVLVGVDGNAVVKNQKLGVAGTEQMLQNHFDKDLNLGPAPTKAQLGEAAKRLGMLPDETGQSVMPGPYALTETEKNNAEYEKLTGKK